MRSEISETASQEQVFVSFAETAKTVLSVAPENVGR